MPTRRGLASLLGGLALYLLARTAGSDDLYPIAAAGILSPVAAVAFVRLRRFSVAFSRAVSPKRVFAGGELEVAITVRNSGRIPSPPLLLREQASPVLGGSSASAVPSLQPGQDLTVSMEREALRRGRYTIGPLRARLLDPFGLAQTSADVVGATVVTVYPAIEPLHETSSPQSREGSGRAMAHRPLHSGDEFYAVRDWENGDDLRKIHWRSTARRDQLMIRQDETAPMPRATLLLDTRAAHHVSGPAGSSFEWMVSAAASIVWELARDGFSLRLATSGGAPSAARWGREATDPLLTQLATLVPSATGTSAAPVRRLASGQTATGSLIAIVPPPHPREPGLPLTRLARAYSWCGAIVLDPASFRSAGPRDVAEADQRIADFERALIRSGWRVVAAGANDSVRETWSALLASRRSRLSSRS